ncbi:MAG: dihydropteroate synthase [Thermoguttaceae bacterium]
MGSPDRLVRTGHWTLRTRTLVFGPAPRIMGIVNVTPDSFSDGGRYLDSSAAIDHGLAMAAQGADLLDVGGESTRPYATPVVAEEELRRVMPVVTALCRQTAVPISIDTSKAAVAREATGAGAEIINDVTGLAGDAAMLGVACESRAGVCIMHMLGTPQTMQDSPAYDNVVAEVMAWLRDRRDALVQQGIAADRIALDPGIGFGKRTGHNLDLLRHAWRLHELGCPLLVGPSRKGFIRQVLADNPGLANDRADLTAGTIGVALALARQGVQILRVHDVAAVRQALSLFNAAGGMQ